jgi:hypothetical protein
MPTGLIPKQPPAAGRPATPAVAAVQPVATRGQAPRAAAAPVTRAPLPNARGAPLPPAKPTPQPARGPESKRRRSSASFNEEAKRAKDFNDVTITRTNVDTDVTQQIPAPVPAASQTQPAGAKKRGRASKPATEELKTPPAPMVAPAAATQEASGARPITTDDIDQWPTQSLSGDDDLDGPDGERTRIGARAYVDAALQGAAIGGESRELTETAKHGGPDLQASQAIRVVVWRTPDGVRVAPAGTTVNAISVEAMLVALDPSADLAAWLKQR